MTMRPRRAPSGWASAAVALALATAVTGCATSAGVDAVEAARETVAAPLPSVRALPPAPVPPPPSATPAPAPAPAPAPEPAPEPAPQAAPADSQAAAVAAAEDAVFALANQARTDAGLAPLTRSGDMDAVARAWSMHLATGGLDLAHNPDFSTQIPGGWSQAAENVGWMGPTTMSGQDVAAQIHAAWMKSEGHRANLLNPALTHIGVGVVDSPAYGWYLTQNFAAY